MCAEAVNDSSLIARHLATPASLPRTAGRGSARPGRRRTRRGGARAPPPLWRARAPGVSSAYPSSWCGTRTAGRRTAACRSARRPCGASAETWTQVHTHIIQHACTRVHQNFDHGIVATNLSTNPLPHSSHSKHLSPRWALRCACKRLSLGVW